MQEQIIHIISLTIAIIVTCGLLCYPFKQIWNKHFVPIFQVIEEINVKQAFWLLILLTLF